jgi:hypothetical protein
MSLLFTDSFGHYPTLITKWDQVANTHGTITISQTLGRGGAPCAALTSTSGNGNNDSWNTGFTKFFPSKSTIYLGFAFYFDPSTMSGGFSGTNYDNYVLILTDGGANQVDVRIKANGQMYVTRNGTTIATASSLYPTTNFHYVELQATINSTTGSITLKFDGNSVATFSGNTQATGNAQVNGVSMGPLGLVNASIANVSAQQYSARWADLYLLDSSGSAHNTFLGDVAIRANFANGNGSLQNYTATIASVARSTVYAVGATVLDTNSAVQRCTAVVSNATSSASNPTWSTTNGGTTTDGNVTWTRQAAGISAYLAVNENFPDDDSSYISSGTVGDQSTFTYPAISGTVVGVVVQARIRKDAGGARSIRAIAKSGATVVDSGTDIPLGTGYSYSTTPLVNDPATGSPWASAASVNAAEFGIKTTV